MSKTSKFIFALLLSSSAFMASAHPLATDTISPKREQGVQFANATKEALERELRNRRVPTFAGVSVVANLAGALLANTTAYGEYEAGVRLNFKNKYFPIAEIGIGASDHSSDASNIHYKVHSPFVRLGMDYNVKKDLLTKNRVLVGARYGFSPFSYDVSGPDLVDAHWGTTVPFHHTGVSGNAHWGELLFGLEAHIWKFIHLGWSVRYRLRIYEKQADMGHAWYVPGYGKNTSGSNFGGTFNLIFDLTRYKKKK